MCDYEGILSLESKVGPIIEKEWICPGVYLLTAKDDDELLGRDYYAIMEKSIIPLRARAYGKKIAGLWLFPITDGGEEYNIINYEVAKYRAQNNLPVEEPLRSTAFFAAQSFPEYFGTFPVPLHTPRGCTIHHWILDNGNRLLESLCCNWLFG